MFGPGSRSCYRVVRSAVVLNALLLAFRASEAQAEPAPAPAPERSKAKAKATAKPVAKRRMVAQAAPPPAAPPPAAPPAAASPPTAAAPPAAPNPPAAAPVAPGAPATSPPATPGSPAPDAPPPPGVDPVAAAPEAPPIDAEGDVEPAVYEDEEIETVKVTVDRRERNIQDYPGAVTAFTQDDLTRTGVRNVRDMAQSSPYMEIGTQEGNTEVFIRGVGSNYNTELGDPAVANHIDGVYIPRPRGIGSMLFDLERVEVNRGPQGTLRGRNATAGTLNVVTAKPKLGEWDASTSFQLGNYSQRVVQGMVNVPIGDTFALRFAAFGETHDSYYKNAGPIHTIEPSESADAVAFRGSAKWQPSEIISLILKADFTQEGGTGFGGTNFTPALEAGLLPEEVPDVRNVYYRGAQGMQDMQHWGLHGELTVDLGPVLVGYVGGYRDLDYESISPGNAGVAFPGRIVTDENLDNWGTSYWHTASQSHIHELRLFAPDDARVRWTLGGFFLDEQQQVLLFNTADKAGGYLGGEYNMPEVPTRSYAGFADLTADILDALRGTAGVRITTEERSRRGVGNQYSLNFTNFTGEMPSAVRFGTEGFSAADRNRTDYTTSAATATDDFLNGIGRFGARDNVDELIEQGATINDGLNEQHGEYSATFFDFRLGADYSISPENLIYIMFSTGHQSGGFNDNVRLANGETIAQEFDPESIYATEIGSKNEFLGRKLVANFAGFWYEYRDQQFQVVQALGEAPDPMTPPPASAVRVNAAKSRVMGLEAEATGRLPAGFTASAAVLLLNARFTDGVVNDQRVNWDPNQQPKVDLEGNFLPRAPVLSLNYGISQLITTGHGYVDWTINAQTRTKHYFTHFNGEGVDTLGQVNPNLSDVQPGYTRLDAGVGYTWPDGKTRIDGFVNNLTNVAYLTTMINQPGLNLRFFNPPRQVGARLTLTL